MILCCQGVVGGLFGALLVLLHTKVLLVRAWAVPRDNKPRYSAVHDYISPCIWFTSAHWRTNNVGACLRWCSWPCQRQQYFLASAMRPPALRCPSHRWVLWHSEAWINQMLVTSIGCCQWRVPLTIAMCTTSVSWCRTLPRILHLVLKSALCHPSPEIPHWMRACFLSFGAQTIRHILHTESFFFSP